MKCGPSGFWSSDRKEVWSEPEEAVEGILSFLAVRNVSSDNQSKRIGTGVDTTHGDVHRDRFSAGSAEREPFSGVVEPTDLIRFDELLDHIRFDADKQVPDPHPQEGLAFEPGQPQGGWIGVDHPMVTWVEDEERIVRLSEQAAGDLLVTIRHRALSQPIGLGTPAEGIALEQPSRP